MAMDGCGPARTSLALCVVVAVTLAPKAFAARPVATVIVPGTQQWTDTGVDVAPGELLAISAWGDWAWGPDPRDWTGPNGSLGAPYIGAMTLMGRIGDAAMFRVGRRLMPWRAPRNVSGRLYLGPQDSHCGDNDGAATARIFIFRHVKSESVPATREWTYSGARLSPGEYCAVQAFGSWAWGPDPLDWTGPDGSPDGAMRLLGETRGEIHSLGSRAFFQTIVGGRLYLGPQDSHCADNQGRVKAFVYW